MCGIQLFVGIYMLLGVQGDDCLYAATVKEPYELTCLKASDIKKITVVRYPSCVSQSSTESQTQSAPASAKQPQGRIDL